MPASKWADRVKQRKSSVGIAGQQAELRTQEQPEHKAGVRTIHHNIRPVSLSGTKKYGHATSKKGLLYSTSPNVGAQLASCGYQIPNLPVK
jgi:hypothetical protein